MREAKVYIVVPAYNEGAVIRQTLQELLQTGYEVVLVDDASTDQTRAEVADLNIHYLYHRLNLGQGAALETGMRYARAKEADYVVHFDADGQHRVEDIEKLLAPLRAGEADICLGSRFMGGSTSGSLPTKRKLLLKAATLVNGLFTGLWLSDAHNGLRALNRQALQGIRLKEPRMAHATEILTEIRRLKLRYREVPVEIRYSDYSLQKGQSLWNAFNILTDLIVRKIFPL
jgi:glycosyltransferase involved in cell wall biosynthesis